jgi:hypothetical protein
MLIFKYGLKSLGRKKIDELDEIDDETKIIPLTPYYYVNDENLKLNLKCLMM